MNQFLRLNCIIIYKPGIVIMGNKRHFRLSITFYIIFQLFENTTTKLDNWNKMFLFSKIKLLFHSNITLM